MEFENTNKNPIKYECKKCDFITSHKGDYNKHLLTRKHKKTQELRILELNGKEKYNILTPETIYKHICSCCNYYTNNLRDMNKHNSTLKHIQNTNNIHNEIKRNICSSCNKEFNTQSGLWKHRKKCVIEENNTLDEDNKVSITNNIPMSLILEVIKQSKEIQNVLIEQTKELQHKLLEKEDQLLEKENKLLEQNKQLLEQNAEHHKQIIELAKKPSIVNSNNTQFNLNFFLNETCKNAMNIQDFIQSIKLTTQDFETTGRLGFVDGISRIFINELKRLEVERRPLHCTDVKRETVYIKDNDTWEKENQEKKKLKWAINSIAQLNLNQVQHWQQEYPECAENNTIANTKFNQMAMIALGGFGDEEETKFRDKIMKNVLREIVLAKDF
uniref:C2H2-type domain-containing protein n=1 Tax=viral metagenome TaxID=1070528 RepID=A0A6C0KGW6_9ZZZZ